MLGKSKVIHRGATIIALTVSAYLMCFGSGGTSPRLTRTDIYLTTPEYPPLNALSTIVGTAQEFLDNLQSNDYPAQWGELSPTAQQLWPSENARDAMLDAKFADAPITSFTLGRPVPGITWTDPENPLVSVSDTWRIPVTMHFLNGTSLLPTGVASLYSMTDASTDLYLSYTPGRSAATVVGEGPASMDAPIIEPWHIPDLAVDVPIFMYHLVAPIPSESAYANAYGWDLDVGLTTLPSQFDAEMAYLHQIKAHSISLQHLSDALLYGLPLQQHSLVITFDDGRLSQWTNAVPILRKYGLTAVFFPCTGLFGVHAGPQTYMTAAQIRDLAYTGFSVEDHTFNDDTSLYHASASLLNFLTGTTKNTLESVTGQSVQYIAYSAPWPWDTASQGGTQEQPLFATLGQQGYLAGLLDLRVDSEEDMSTALWQLPRVRIGLGISLTDFAGWFTAPSTLTTIATGTASSTSSTTIQSTHTPSPSPSPSSTPRPTPTPPAEQ